MSKAYQMLINGKWVNSSSGKTIASVNPTDESELWSVQAGNSVDVDLAVNSAKVAFEGSEWRSYSYKDRADILREIADLIMENATSLSQIESLENGKPIKESSLIDIPEAAETFRIFASMVLQLKGESYPSDGTTLSYTFYEPIGVVAAVIPWNYPLLMAAWKIAPAIAAGNTVVIKPSELTSATLLELGKLLGQTSLPDGVVNIVTGTGEEVGKPLVSNPKIDKISFTGSTQTGSEIMERSAKNIVPTTMELGGKSATILTKDANIDTAIMGILTSIFMNQGQMCVAGSRLLIEEGVYDAVLDKLKEKLRKFSIGCSTP